MSEFENAIVLSEPPERGERVKDAQWLLAGNDDRSKKLTGFRGRYTGKLDGVAGPATLAAARRVKFDIGYDAEALEPSFGQHLYDYLVGRERQTTAMRATAIRRKAAAQPSRSYPLAVKGRLIGFPGQGTHSFWAPPNNWQSDRAFDISIPVGTPVLAIEAGRIDPVRYGDLGHDSGRFYGKRLTLLGGSGNQYYYAHNTVLVAARGQRVVAGQVIARSGSAVGIAHLHIACEHGNEYREIVGWPVARTLAHKALGKVGVNFAADVPGVDAEAWAEYHEAIGLDTDGTSR